MWTLVPGTCLEHDDGYSHHLFRAEAVQQQDALSTRAKREDLQPALGRESMHELGGLQVQALAFASMHGCAMTEAPCTDPPHTLLSVLGDIARSNRLGVVGGFEEDILGRAQQCNGCHKRLLQSDQDAGRGAGSEVHTDHRLEAMGCEEVGWTMVGRMALGKLQLATQDALRSRSEGRLRVGST